MNATKATPTKVLVGFVKELVVITLAGLLLAVGLKTFAVQAFYVPTGSMFNTILKDDKVLVSKFTPELFPLHRGDVIVFRDPAHWLAMSSESQPEGSSGTLKVLSFLGLAPESSSSHLIKRVIGLPGDRVAVDDQGRMTVNGAAITEPYLYPGDSSSSYSFTITVPQGQLWVMGDHRSDSGDSRVHGMVPISDVVGKAFAVIWPFDDAGGLKGDVTSLRAAPAAPKGS